jgi:hypothetical protein
VYSSGVTPAAATPTSTRSFAGCGLGNSVCRNPLDALLLGIAERIGRPAYRGCPFLNLVTEVPDQNHPGRVVAQGNKEELRARLATIVARLGVFDPYRVASQLALVINGAYATGLIAESADLSGDLVDAAEKL